MISFASVRLRGLILLTLLLLAACGSQPRA